MARVTVEDCLEKVDNQYDLVLLAKERTVQLNAGSPMLVEEDNDKRTIISLREIGDGKVSIKELETSIIRYSYTFYTYGLHLNKPIQNQYDYLNLENNVLNISWSEDNSQGNILKLDLLDENQNFLKTSDYKSRQEIILKISLCILKIYSG